MATFNADAAAVQYIGNYTDAAGQRRLIARNNELWFRVYGDSLTIDYRNSASTGDAMHISIDGGAFSAVNLAGTGGGTGTSGNLISGASDGYHDIVLRVVNGYREAIYLVITAGITVTSSGGTAELAAHSEVGAFETVRGSHGSSYWFDTLSADNESLAGGYSSPIFPAAKPAAGYALHSEAYCEFLVDGSTTQIRPIVTFDSNVWIGVWVDGKQVFKYQCATSISSFVGSLEEPIPIPGSGTRTVRIANVKGLYGIITDGGFVTTAVDQPENLVLGFGDSVTEGRSVTYDRYSATGHILGSIIRGDFAWKNAGLSGDTAVAATTNGRVTKDIVPFSPTHVVFHFGTNDAARWLSATATVQAEYETLIQEVLDNTSADVIVMAPLTNLTANRSTIVTGLQNAVANIADSRCTYYSTDDWTTDDLREGSHPNTLGYGLQYGYGVVEFLGQPSDGDTVTRDGVTYEFESSGGVTGGNVAVTIGADVVETVQNLSAAMEGQGQTVAVEHVEASGSINEGLVVPVTASLSASGANLDPYFDGDGWKDFYGSLFDAVSNPANLLMMGVG